MTVFALETNRSFSPSIGSFKSLFSKYGEEANTRDGYTGLIQFGKSASIDIGKKRSELMNLTAEEQLDYVLKYFQLPTFKQGFKNSAHLYLAVNYPEAYRKYSKTGDDQIIIYAYPNPAYDSNPSFKRENTSLQ